MLVKERLSKGTWVPPWLLHQHVARYDWVRRYCERRVVLDAACANGYGTRAISTLATRAFGCDISIEPIVEANGEMFDLAPLMVGDTLSLPFRDRSFEVFVSFETIEHVNDDSKFVAEARRVVKPGGLLIVSTPNRLLVNPGNTIADRPFNPYHVREYSPAELEALLRSGFDHVEMMGQRGFHAAYRRTLGWIGRASRTAGFRLHQARKLLTLPLERREWHEPRAFHGADEPEVLIAVCS